MLPPRDRDGLPCRRGCGVPGVHPTIDDCLEAQRAAIARLRARPPPDPPPIPVPAPRRHYGPRTMIDPTVKAAIVAEMFLAPPGAILAATRRLGLVYGLKAETIQTSWRRWATERTAGTL